MLQLYWLILVSGKYKKKKPFILFCFVLSYFVFVKIVLSDLKIRNLELFWKAKL